MSDSPNVERRRSLPWRAPLEVAAGLRDEDGALALLSDGGPLGRWSFVAAEPDLTRIVDDFGGDLAGLDDPALAGSVVGLLSYDAGARVATGRRTRIWPDLMLARYPAMLAFDHETGQVEAIGRGRDAPAAAAAVARAEIWMGRAVAAHPPPAPAEVMAQDGSNADYLAAVADVRARIAAGDLFQANIARAWFGRLRPDRDPFDVMLRLAGREAAYGAFWRLGDYAVVSNSPELFVRFQTGTRQIETRPIKGTRRRDADPTRDAEQASALRASVKDRAENLMIVDLMRNDLSRVAEPGSVEAPARFEVESHPTVHHLVSTVVATARPGIGSRDLLEATFPPGSITGAPKHQAMKVIADHEPPRGAWCGSLFHIDASGDLTASVLIRTVAFTRDADGWAFRTQAGAGIVADSDPAAELDETDAKISALREALIG